jgi:hypothetical protein
MQRARRAEKRASNTAKAKAAAAATRTALVQKLHRRSSSGPTASGGGWAGASGLASVEADTEAAATSSERAATHRLASSSAPAADAHGDGHKAARKAKRQQQAVEAAAAGKAGSKLGQPGVSESAGERASGPQPISQAAGGSNKRARPGGSPAEEDGTEQVLTGLDAARLLKSGGVGRGLANGAGTKSATGTGRWDDVDQHLAQQQDTLISSQAKSQRRCGAGLARV